MKPAARFNGEYETAIFYVSDIGLHLRAYKDKRVRACRFA